MNVELLINKTIIGIICCFITLTIALLINWFYEQRDCPTLKFTIAFQLLGFILLMLLVYGKDLQ